LELRPERWFYQRLKSVFTIALVSNGMQLSIAKSVIAVQLRRGYCVVVIAAWLLRCGYCGVVIALWLLRRGYCVVVIAAWLLRCGYCGVVIA
jgi:hypothetical protein